MEDLLEKIHLLTETKGYARVVDIADRLKVSPSNVTRMIQKLDERGYAKYEKYRGITLTSRGSAIAKEMIRKHQLLEEFLRVIGVAEEYIYADVEGLEHHISGNTAFCISTVVRFFEQHPEIRKTFHQYRLAQQLRQIPHHNHSAPNI